MDTVLQKLSFAAESKKERNQIDLDLWSRWNEGGQRPEDLRPLLKRFRPMIRKWSNKYAGATRDVEIPPAAVHAEFNKWFLHAVDRYDPNRGTALGTWVDHNLQKGQRWVMNRRNIARIEEKRAYKVGQFNRAKAVLDDQLGREPSTREMSEYLGWDEKRVGLMQREIRKTLTSSKWETIEGGMDPTFNVPTREREVLRNIRYNLSNEELQVYEYTLGINGKPRLKPSQIAAQLGMHPSKVTRLRKSISSKIDEYMAK